MDSFVFFWAAFSLLLVHEMDAVRLREWKIFPGLGALPEARGYTLFTALHVPLYILLLWALLPGDGSVNQRVVVGIDLFCLIHVGLHLIFRNHPDNHFRAPFSWALILGAGVAGGIDLGMRL